jgi:hypothetical protein
MSTVTTTNTSSKPSASLAETVGAFRRDMVRLRAELQEAHREIGRLKRELGQVPAAPPVAGKTKLRVLRRQVSFYCHPDRGGDENLMKSLNALFDYLECSA